MNLADRNSLPTRKNQIYCACRNSSKRRDQRLLLWSGAAKRRAGCAALRVGPKRPSQRWLPLVWRRRDVPSAIVSTCLWYVVFHKVTGCCCCCCCTSLRVRFHGRCAPGVLLLVSRPTPTECSLATERRAASRPLVGREATSLYSCVTIQLIDRCAAVS